MSLDPNGVLYAAFTNFAIYRLFPWSSTFEIFAGIPGSPPGSKIVDGKRTSKNSNSIAQFGLISHIDALGAPGFVWVVDGKKHHVRSIETKNKGVVVRFIRRLVALSKNQLHLLSMFYASYVLYIIHILTRREMPLVHSENLAIKRHV